MGIITIDQANRLYWLGRYTERVYTTIKYFSMSFDRMIAHDEAACGEFCASLDIPNIYSDWDDFLKRYNFDRSNPDSVISNLIRVYDNAVVMRDELGSDCLCYVQLAVYAMERAAQSKTPYIDIQKVSDNILAFWGICDDLIESENVRNIIKVGKRIERIDLYARLRLPADSLSREVRRLQGRIGRTNLRYDAEKVEKLLPLTEKVEVPYREIVSLVESIADV